MGIRRAKPKIRKIIAELQQDIVSTDELINIIGSRIPEFTPDDLTTLWQDRLIFPDHIERDSKDYNPAKDCRWNTKPTIGFYNFDRTMGAYLVSENLSNYVTSHIEGSIIIGKTLTSLSLSNDKSEIAIGCSYGYIVLCNPRNASISHILKKGNDRVWAIKYSPDGSFLVSGQQDGKICFWAGNEQKKEYDSQDWIRAIDFSPVKGEFLTGHSARNDRAFIRQWATDPVADVGSFRHIADVVWVLRYIPDGSGFVSGGKDHKVTCWSYTTGATLWSSKKHNNTVTTLAMHPKGGVVASGALSGGIKIWDLEDGENVKSMELHSERVTALAFSPDGRFLVSGGKDTTIGVWLLPSGLLAHRFQAHLGWVRGIEFISDDRIVSIGSEGVCKLWRFEFKLPPALLENIPITAEEVRNEFRGAMDDAE